MICIPIGKGPIGKSICTTAFTGNYKWKMIQIHDSGSFGTESWDLQPHLCHTPSNTFLCKYGISPSKYFFHWYSNVDLSSHFIRVPTCYSLLSILNNLMSPYAIGVISQEMTTVTRWYKVLILALIQSVDSGFFRAKIGDLKSYLCDNGLIA